MHTDVQIKSGLLEDRYCVELTLPLIGDSNISLVKFKGLHKSPLNVTKKCSTIAYRQIVT